MTDIHAHYDDAKFDGDREELLASLSYMKIINAGCDRISSEKARALAEKYEKLAKDKSSEIGIAHADAPEDAEILLKELRKRGFTGKCYNVCYEPVTGAHVGPGTVALFFPGTEK